MEISPDDEGIAAELERELRVLEQETTLSDLESDVSSDDEAVVTPHESDDQSRETFLRLKQCIEESDSLIISSFQTGGPVHQKENTPEQIQPSSELSDTLPYRSCEHEGQRGEESPTYCTLDRDESADGIDEKAEILIKRLEEKRQAELQREQIKLAAIEERRRQQEDRESESVLMAVEDFVGSLIMEEERRQRKKEVDLMGAEDDRGHALLLERKSERQRATRETEMMEKEDNASRHTRDCMVAELARERALMGAEDEASDHYAKWLKNEMLRERKYMEEEDKASRNRIKHERIEQLSAMQTKPVCNVVMRRKFVFNTNLSSIHSVQENFAEQCERWIPTLYPLPSTSKGVHVRALCIAGRGITNISPIAQLIHLERLDVSRNPLDSFNALWLSPRLMMLSASACGLGSIIGVINCPVIQLIDLSQNHLVTLTIDPAPFLKTLLLENNPMQNAPVLRWSPRLQQKTTLIDIGGWKGIAWQKRLQVNPKSLREAVSALSDPAINRWHRNAAECIRDWWRLYSKRRKVRKAIAIQRQWRRYLRRRQASQVVQRWWRSVAIKRKIRQVRSRLTSNDDDIERLNDEFFEFIRGELPEFIETQQDVSNLLINGQGEFEHQVEENTESGVLQKNYHNGGEPRQPMSGFSTTTSEANFERHERNCMESLMEESELPKDSRTMLKQEMDETISITDRPASVSSTNDEQFNEERNTNGWNFSSEATKRAFLKKARRMRQLRAQKARREASPMQRVNYLRKSLKMNRLKYASTEG